MTNSTDVTDETDVVVIGLGPGGGEVASALLDAGLGVVGVERELVGGECPYWGCIPSKMAVRAAGALAEARRVPLLAGDAQVRPDYAAVAHRIRAEATDDWDDAVAVARFEKAGGRFLRGAAVIEGQGRVRVDGEVVAARRGVVVATGSAPVRPPIPGLADAGYWTNREAIAATRAPESLVVLGGGAIGLELAQAFARFGTAVTVVEGADRVLPMEEPEASVLAADALVEDGATLRVGRRAVAVSRNSGITTVELDDGSTVTEPLSRAPVGPSTPGPGVRDADRVNRERQTGYAQRRAPCLLAPQVVHRRRVRAGVRPVARAAGGDTLVGWRVVRVGDRRAGGDAAVHVVPVRGRHAGRRGLPRPRDPRRPAVGLLQRAARHHGSTTTPSPTSTRPATSSGTAGCTTGGHTRWSTPRRARVGGGHGGDERDRHAWCAARRRAGPGCAVVGAGAVGVPAGSRGGGASPGGAGAIR
jgi:thioredoxin reductase